MPILHTIACATVLGALLTVFLACVVGHLFGAVFAAEMARALLGVRPI